MLPKGLSGIVVSEWRTAHTAGAQVFEGALPDIPVMIFIMELLYRAPLAVVRDTA
jgi:hypothetical protein